MTIRVKLALIFATVLCFTSMSPETPRRDLIGEEDASCLTYIPSAISPNGDGINDIFEIRHSCLVAEMNLEIFNDSGDMVFATVDTKPFWNGMVRNVPAMPGRYSWVISYNANETLVRKEGQFVLVR